MSEEAERGPKRGKPRAKSSATDAKALEELFATHWGDGVDWLWARGRPVDRRSIGRPTE